MANTYTTLNDLFAAIADSIRAKKKSSESIVADTFPTEIANLQTGFDYNNHEVTTISDYAFKNCEDLNSVDCYNLTSIGTSAFENCKNLKSVILYDSVTSVGENAFKGCSDTVIYCKLSSIPETWHENWNPDNCPVIYGELLETWDVSATSEDNVTALICDIGDNYTLYIIGNGNMVSYTYDGTPWYNNYRTQISSVLISDGVTSISSYAFQNCSNLTSINIPDSVTSIGFAAFANCTSLIYNEYDNAYYLGNENNPYTVLVKAKNKNITSCNINTNTKIIHNRAFEDCSSLTSINIPDSVISIDDGAFSDCYSLTSITIPDSVTSIGQRAFSYCNGLTSVTIGNSVTAIGDYAFSGCRGLTSVNIPDSVTSIGNYAFVNCTSLIYNEYDNAYYLGNENNPYTVLVKAKNKNITSCNINTNTKIIHNRAFSDCSNLTSINIPDSVTSISDETFYDCDNLTSINIPNSVTSISDGTFYNCDNLTSINIPNSVTSIGNRAFSDCYSLTSITIPDSVISIGEYEFYNVGALIITYEGAMAQWNAIKKGKSWNVDSVNNNRIEAIHCTDGTITYK